VSEGFQVEVDQIRAHAGHIDALRARFDAVRAASAHIAQDESAYGLLCGWIAAVLEGRHTRQDELIAYVEENLLLVADRLRQTADAYERADADNAGLFDQGAAWTGGGTP